MKKMMTAVTALLLVSMIGCISDLPSPGPGESTISQNFCEWTYDPSSGIYWFDCGDAGSGGDGGGGDGGGGGGGGGGGEDGCPGQHGGGVILPLQCDASSTQEEADAFCSSMCNGPAFCNVITTANTGVCHRL